jgi:hypothetical protein
LEIGLEEDLTRKGGFKMGIIKDKLHILIFGFLGKWLPSDCAPDPVCAFIPRGERWPPCGNPPSGGCKSCFGGRN